MKKYNLVASLEYGKILSLSTRVVLYVIMIACVIFCPVFMILCLKVDIVGGIVGLFVCVAWFVLSLLFILRDNRILKVYKNCLEDAVELEAESFITDRAVESIRTCLKVRISVKFYFDKKLITKKSGDPNYNQIFDGSKRAGYNVVFNKYSDRKIKILYSKKYDHVFILKD